MNRRKFITSSVLTGIGSAGAFAKGIPVNQLKEEQQFFELRQYTLKAGNSAGKIDNYFENALVPALNRAGIKPVGIFKAQHGFDNQTRFVVIPYESFQHHLDVRVQLHTDPLYIKANDEVIHGTPEDVPYLKYDASFLKAFKYMPKIEPPDKNHYENPVYELRIYQSQNYLAGQKKIEMFNEGGELAIFRETGLTPVFFGETLVGQRMPNLTYLLVFRNLAEREQNWETFRTAPAWKALSGKEEYKQIVSNISSYILQPGRGTQL